VDEVTLRPVEAGDIASIGRIYREAVLNGAASFEINPPGDHEMARRMAALVDGGFPYVVAACGADVLGYAYAGPYRTRPAYRFTVEDSIYIDANARGRGIGSALLSRILAACEVLGFRQMVAIIGDSANEASIALHRRAGFRLTGTLEAVGWKHGRWVDSVIMQCGLGSGAQHPPDTARAVRDLSEAVAFDANEPTL
jgi:L-amino acid N-acyltransferase YncA